MKLLVIKRDVLRDINPVDILGMNIPIKDYNVS